MLYKFPCGCLIESPEPDSFDFDFDTIAMDCPAVYNMLGRGLTKGVFQLESPLARQTTKELKPENIEHLTALGSILRPGSLQALDENGVSTTKHYILRKNTLEEVPPFHPVVDEVLKDTFGLIIYQEQAIRIAVEVAGFSPTEANTLRSSLGKKKADLMAQCRVLFLDKAEWANVVSKEQAITLFNLIQAGQRYAFNKSHAYCYAVQAYRTAYAKAHLPNKFFTSWMRFARMKKTSAKEEVFELVSEANLFDIEFVPSDVCEKSLETIANGNTISLGIMNIKGMQSTAAAELVQHLHAVEKASSKPLSQWGWYEFLVKCGAVIGETRMADLARVGAFRNLKGFPGRKWAMMDLSVWHSLSDKSQLWCQEHYKEYPDLVALLKGCARPKKEGGGVHNVNQISKILSQVSLLENPPASLEDSPQWISWEEERLLGVALSVCVSDTVDESEVNCSCKDFLGGRGGPKDQLIFAVKLRGVRLTTTKKGKEPGKEMAIMSIYDGQCVLENVVAFPETYAKFKDFIYDDNKVLLQGCRTKTDSLSVTKIWQA